MCQHGVGVSTPPPSCCFWDWFLERTQRLSGHGTAADTGLWNRRSRGFMVVKEWGKLDLVLGLKNPWHQISRSKWLPLSEQLNDIYIHLIKSQGDLITKSSVFCCSFLKVRDCVCCFFVVVVSLRLLDHLFVPFWIL